jgi:hypothetical protein
MNKINNKNKTIIIFLILILFICSNYVKGFSEWWEDSKVK